MRTNSAKDAQNNQKAVHTRRSWKVLSKVSVFLDCAEQQIPRPENKRRKKMHYSGKRKRHDVKTPLMVNNQGVIIHKAKHKKGHLHDYDIHKKSHPVTPKQAVSMFDLGCLWSGERLSRAKVIHAKQKETKHRIVSGKRSQQKPF